VNIAGFAARADIVGRRIRISWAFVPEPGETLADIPPVTLRRKLRDYAYPAVDDPDPYLVYDSNGFPPAPVPAALTVTDLDGWERVANGERVVVEPVSVAILVSGQFVEVLRRTVATVFDLNGAALRQRVEILDVGMLPGALQPNQTYYYQLFSRDLPTGGDAAAPYRDTAMATDSYGQNRVLYQSLPEVYRRHDVITRPAAPGQDSVPELAPGFGQLRRFLDPFGIAFDSLRGTAEGIRTLHDIDNVEAKYLPLIAQWIGWDLSVEVDIPLRRNELKTANRLYALVGTLPGLRALVTQFTGWFAQIGEFAQNIGQSNQPPRRNLFAITGAADGKSWYGVDDAAELLGFGPGHQQAAGTAAAAASLTGTAAEPFALRPGMSLTLAVDRLLPASVRFGQQDFADITQARAAEIAAAINRALPEAHAQATGGALMIASETVGPQSLLRILPSPTSLVSLAGSPTGRLSPCADLAGRIRLFYEAWETPTRPASDVAAAAAAATDSGNQALRRVRYKTFVDGAWRDAQPIFTETVTPQADPAAVVLPDHRIWVAWLDDPLTARTRLRWALGRSATPMPARLLGQKSEPFALTDAGVLTLTGHWPGVDRYIVHRADFADISSATAAELVAAMNAQLTQTLAAREQNGSVTLATRAGGALATLAVDLSRSTTARALGFDNRNSLGTPGSWSDLIDWTAPMDAVSIGPGRHAELAATGDPAGGVRFAWASHAEGIWRIEVAHWNDRVLVATANGAFVRDQLGPWSTLAGLPSPDVRAIAVDANATAWIATASGVTLRHPDGTIAALTPALPSLDIRDLALGADGVAWIATGAGAVMRAADGTLTTLNTAAGLPSNDVRAVTLEADGTLWAATAAGAVERAPDGTLRLFNTPALPSNVVQGVAADGAGTVYFATTAGLAILSAGGAMTVVDASTGLGSSDVRAVAAPSDGTLWAATAGGVGRRAPTGAWTVIDPADGLPSADTRSLSLGPDGTVWVGTALGVSTIGPDGSVGDIDLLGGGAVNPAGRAVHTGWSAKLELANGGGGNREPVLATDQTGRTWLVWSQRIGIGTADDNWALHARIYDPAALGWGADITLTAPPAGGRTADRTPAVQALPAAMRVYFASDRGGGSSLWSSDVSLTGAAAAPVALPATGSSDLGPAPIPVGAALWLVFRGDANISLAQVGASALDDALLGSVRVPDNGAIRRYAGTVAADLSDLNRLRTRRVFGDMLSYTPNRPDNVGTLTDDELYTRGTVGIYVSSPSLGVALTNAEVGRLRELLQRFIPINLRAVVIVVEPVELEIVFATPIADSYNDDYPFASALGPVTDSAAAAIAGLAALVSNTLGDVSANPADLTTLRRRSFFPPLQ
jgi:phage tail-like protein